MLNKITIKSSLIVLIVLTNLVSLALGTVGLIQFSNAQKAFEQIFQNRVVSTGLLRTVQLAYTVRITGAANKFADGLMTGDEAQTEINDAVAEIATTRPKFMALQTQDVDKQMAT